VPLSAGRRGATRLVSRGGDPEPRRDGGTCSSLLLGAREGRAGARTARFHRLTEAGEAPLPRLTPPGLRRTFASVMYAIGEDPEAVMDDLGHNDPGLAMTVYASR
jgi:integrase